MILFGTRTMNSAQESGEFQCPRCSTSRHYVRHQVNRWFTLYFIPCIPLGKVGEYIECRGCGGTFGVEVLSYNPEAERAALLETFRRIMVLAMVCARRTERHNVRALRDVCSVAFNEAPTEEEVDRDIRFARQADAPLASFVAARASTFSEQGKQLMVESAARILASEGALTESDREVLRTLGSAVGMAPTGVEALIPSNSQAIGDQR